MTKKNIVIGILAIALVFGMTGQGAFAQEKHQPFDVLIGINTGFGISPNIFGLFKSISDQKIPKGNYAIIIDFGITGDFYLFNWLSFNSGLFLHPDLYVLLDQEIKGKFEFKDIAATPLCLTIPLAAHINIPNVEWLYAGAGLSLNIPLFGLLDSTVNKVAGKNIDTKGDFFVGLPIDIGFDFIKPGRGGTRFFFRVTPEFHKKRTTVPIGFIWQSWNWRIFSR